MTQHPRSTIADERNAPVEDVRRHLGQALSKLEELCQVLSGVGLAARERVGRGGRS